MRYNSTYAAWVLHTGHRLGSPSWTSSERRDFIAAMRMGGEL